MQLRLRLNSINRFSKFRVKKHNIIGYSKFVEDHKEEYSSWKHMRDRIFNSNNKDFKYYGGRGITICLEWSSFIKFVEDMGSPPIDNLGRRFTLDRKDNNGNYNKENCKWSSCEEQLQNKNNISPERQIRLRSVSFN